jgi:hypothetical protein
VAVCGGNLPHHGFAGSSDLGSDAITRQYGNQGVQGRVSSKVAIAASCFCRKPS